jgi:tetratricopeptide (TPR) repeat protein
MNATKGGGANLGQELEALLDKEVGFMGPLILRKQCKDMGIKFEEMGPSHLKELSEKIRWAISPLVGEQRASAISKGMLEYMSALETLEAAPSEKESDRPSQLLAELTVVESKLAAGLVEGAEDAARRAVALLGKKQDPMNARHGPKALRLLARVLSSRGETHEEAFKLYGQALDLAKDGGDAYEQVLALSGLGALFWRTGKHRKALEHFNKALALVNALPVVSKGDRQRADSMRSSIHSGLGNVYLDLIDFKAAIEHNEKALAISRDMGNLPEVGRVFNNLARVYEEARDYIRAIDCYERGINYCQRGKASRMEGWTLTNLASALIDNGRPGDAKAHLERAERILGDFRDPIAQSKLNCMWGKYHRERREWQRGIDRFARSIEVIANENAPDYVATTQEEFGTLYQQMGEREKAREMLGAALEWQKEKGDQYRMEKITKQLKELKKK